MEKYPFENELSLSEPESGGNEEIPVVIAENSFSPGPYIAGCLVPRCFDTSRHVQATALQSLHSLLQVMITFEKWSKQKSQSLKFQKYQIGINTRLNYVILCSSHIKNQS